jgi:hypothetical protein
MSCAVMERSLRLAVDALWYNKNIHSEYCGISILPPFPLHSSLPMSPLGPWPALATLVSLFAFFPACPSTLHGSNLTLLVLCYWRLTNKCHMTFKLPATTRNADLEHACTAIIITIHKIISNSHSHQAVNTLYTGTDLKTQYSPAAGPSGQS